MLKTCCVCNQEKTIDNFYYWKTRNAYKAQCKQCESIRAKKYYINNKENVDKKNKQYNEINKNKLKEYHKKYAIENYDKIKNYHNSNKKIIKKYQDEYRENNREKLRDYFRVYDKIRTKEKTHYSNIRRTKKLQATPAWADLEAIKEFYKNCPEGYHVDHIIPLQGENVCGLHVLENLQYLPAVENLKKGNKFPIEE